MFLDLDACHARKLVLADARIWQQCVVIESMLTARLWNCQLGTSWRVNQCPSQSGSSVSHLPPIQSNTAEEAEDDDYDHNARLDDRPLQP